jgi:plasmid stability protein
LPPAAPDCLQALIKVQSLIDCEPMATMTIRNIDDQLKARLRVRAAQHGRSMEDEARNILRAALSTPSSGPASLVDSIRARIEPLGGVELELPPREPLRTPPDFGV